MLAWSLHFFYFTRKPPPPPPPPHPSYSLFNSPELGIKLFENILRPAWKELFSNTIIYCIFKKNIAGNILIVTVLLYNKDFFTSYSPSASYSSSVPLEFHWSVLKIASTSMALQIA